jgi:hypothetical protein
LYEKSKLDSVIIIGAPATCVFRDYASVLWCRCGLSKERGGARTEVAIY